LSTTPKTAGQEPGISVKALQAFYQNCIKRWSDPRRYALDSRYVDLTLLLDQGVDAQGPRWQAKSESFQTLQQVLSNTAGPLVILGAPGCGKSTLLRHYELENAQASLAELEQTGSANTPLTFFIQLNDFKGPRPGDPAPLPQTWLAERWALQNPDLPDLRTLMHQGRITLLLDALNEIPYRNTEVIQLWKDFLSDLENFHSATRIIFSCRSLDYSAPLSSKDRPVPQVRIESLSDDKVRDFLQKYSPRYGETLWNNLKNTAQLNVFRSPYFLNMLIDESVDGEIPKGRAALFTVFVRRLIKREIDNPDNKLFQAGELLHGRDIQRLMLVHNGKTPSELPKRGLLIPKLSLLAFQMQKESKRQESGLIKIDYDQALASLDHPLSEKILEAGVAMSVLEQDLTQDQVYYIHQLLQEYFAAQHFAVAPEPELAQ
jgi:predicted NACHT family NTPase